jgi:hypothetical protein
MWEWAMRDEIVRDDFPSARRGYDPAAVRAHLDSAWAYLESVRQTPLAHTAANKVADIVAAAERTATEIEQEARREAEQAQREAVEIREQASREAQQIIDTARSKGNEQTERAEGALVRLIDEADRLRSALATLGQEFTTEMQANGMPDMTPAGAPAGEAPSLQALFPLRRPDSGPLGPTGEAEPESASAAERRLVVRALGVREAPDAPQTAEPENGPGFAPSKERSEAEVQTHPTAHP